MNTRLKIVCILFGIAYLYFVGATIIDEIPEDISSFKEGFRKGVTLYDDQKTVNNVSGETDYTETLFFNVKPLSGFFSFPSSITNLETGNPIRTEYQVFIAKVDKTLLPLWIKTGYVFLLLLAVPMLFAIIFIPVQIYRVIRSIVKNEIFNHQNINRIRWIGYCLLFIFAVEIYASFIYYVEARSLVRMEDYKVIFKMGEEYYWLLFALITFMFAEILKISHTMKEEQDLTI